MNETTTINCVSCEEPLDPRAEHAELNLDPSANTVGFTVGWLCDDCADKFQKKMEEASDRMGGGMP